VLRARELGFSLDEIRELLRLVDERDRPCAEARDVAAVHLADVRAKIADLKRMERVLKDVVAQCGAGTRRECPLIDMLFGKSAVN
jgi:MerR family mercuric resistance operon transcriptional regulator